MPDTVRAQDANDNSIISEQRQAENGPRISIAVNVFIAKFHLFKDALIFGFSF